MEYFFKKRQLYCSRCKAHINVNVGKDRHSCYWADLEERPIGMLALMLSGQFKTYNPLERRIARGIWERAKSKNKPKRLKKIKMFNTTNVKIYENWVRRGDAALSEDTLKCI